MSKYEYNTPGYALCRAMEALGFSAEEVMKAYQHLLDAARYGAMAYDGADCLGGAEEHIRIVLENIFGAIYSLRALQDAYDAADPGTGEDQNMQKE